MIRKFLLIFTIAFISCYSVNSQPGDPGEDPDVPIGGIELLLLAGGALGVRKMIKRK